ncbi:930_t:CDS:2 [Gigaspora margarita]|uniref:930_t:CDS:1 n=1 Tax=Gigaspora margarita TaxID=4874 RepID=A0ABM8W6J3_GIGMA|nr:930_t:CDS:2 [Gigaspora margarita]
MLTHRQTEIIKKEIGGPSSVNATNNQPTDETLRTQIIIAQIQEGLEHLN